MSNDKYTNAFWLVAFLPALLFYLNLLSSTFFINRYLIVSNTIVDHTHYAHTSSVSECSNDDDDSYHALLLLSDLLHVNKATNDLDFGLELLWESNHESSFYTGLVWYEDEELGRGFLLYSDTGANRIWRWEIGGGPIAIGRTLYMERSGCRSNTTLCESIATVSGSSGAAIEVGGSLDSSGNRKLVICERGERRVVRIEEDGARTPLATHTHFHLRGDPKLNGPYDLVYGPFGDLIFTDPISSNHIIESGYHGGIWRVPEASRVKAIKATMSKQAHFLKSSPNKIELIYSHLKTPRGIVFSKNLENILVTNSDDLRIYRLPIGTLDTESDNDIPGRRLMMSDEDEIDIQIKMLEYENSLGDSSDQEDLDEYIKKLEDEMNKLEDGEEQPNLISGESLIDSDMVKDEGNHSDRTATNIGLLDMHDPSDLVFFDANKLSLNCTELGGMEVDIKGNVWVAAGSCGVAILSSTGNLLGQIIYHDEFIVDVSFGGDGFMYATTPGKLLRIKVKTKGYKTPDMLNRSL